MVIEPHSLKILPSLLHSYHDLQLQNIAIFALAFLPCNSNFFLLFLTWNFLGFVIQWCQQEDSYKCLPRPTFPYQLFNKFACCVTINFLSTFFCPYQINALIIYCSSIFKVKPIFSFNSLLVGLNFQLNSLTDIFLQFSHYETKNQ